MDRFVIKRGRSRHGYARTDPRRNHTGWWARVSVYRHGTRQGSGDGAEAQGQHDDGGVHLLERGLWVAQADETKGGLPSYPQPPSNPHHPPGGSSLIAHRNSLFCPTRFPVPKLGNSLFARKREMVANSLNQ